jgi:hypothetical protein
MNLDGPMWKQHGDVLALPRFLGFQVLEDKLVGRAAAKQLQRPSANFAPETIIIY